MLRLPAPRDRNPLPLFERLTHSGDDGLRRLRAREAHSAVDDEKRHPVHTDALRFLNVGAHGILVVVQAKSHPYSGPIHSAGCGGAGEHVRVAHIRAFQKIQGQQTLFHEILHACLSRPADEAVGVERVWRAGDCVELEGYPGLGADSVQAAIDLGRFLGGELAREIFGARDAAWRNGVVELIWSPANDDVEVRRQRARRLQSAFAWPAPMM